MQSHLFIFLSSWASPYRHQLLQSQFFPRIKAISKVTLSTGLAPGSLRNTQVPEPPQSPLRAMLYPWAPPPLSLRPPASSSGSTTLVWEPTALAPPLPQAAAPRASLLPLHLCPLQCLLDSPWSLLSLCRWHVYSVHPKWPNLRVPFPARALPMSILYPNSQAQVAASDGPSQTTASSGKSRHFSIQPQGHLCPLREITF